MIKDKDYKYIVYFGVNYNNRFEIFKSKVDAEAFIAFELNDTTDPEGLKENLRVIRATEAYEMDFCVGVTLTPRLEQDRR